MRQLIGLPRLNGCTIQGSPRLSILELLDLGLSRERNLRPKPSDLRVGRKIRNLSCAPKVVLTRPQHSRLSLSLKLTTRKLLNIDIRIRHYLVSCNFWKTPTSGSRDTLFLFVSCLEPPSRRPEGAQISIHSE